MLSKPRPQAKFAYRSRDAFQDHPWIRLLASLGLHARAPVEKKPAAESNEFGVIVNISVDGNRIREISWRVPLSIRMLAGDNGVDTKNQAFVRCRISEPAGLEQLRMLRESQCA